MFRSVIPERVFEMTLQFENGADYREFAYLSDELGFCDLSRPAPVRDCHVDLAALVRQFRHVDIVKQLASAPDSIQWDAWDWETMTQKPGGYTPVFLAAEIKEWNPETQQVHSWWLACSILPENTNVAVCQEVDFVDSGQEQVVVKTNLALEQRLTMVRADWLTTIQQSVEEKVTVAGVPDTTTGNGLGTIMDDIYQ